METIKNQAPSFSTNPLSAKLSRHRELLSLMVRRQKEIEIENIGGKSLNSRILLLNFFSKKYYCCE